ncbi:tyrosine-type recombinase/integrase [bacterium]|nr:tyrosine-type recombinase/integrase [bacterium]
MASLQQKGNGWYCQFLFQKKRYTFSLGPVSSTEAETKASQVDYLLLRLKQHLAVLPPGVGIVEYVQFDGRIVPPESPAAEALPLSMLREKYLATHEASLEPSTLACIRIHFKHLEKILGAAFSVTELQLVDLQGYVDKRGKAKGRGGRRLSAMTIHKEIVTLRTAWNWAVKMDYLSGRFPNNGLRYPKTHEKPPFQTRQEIERQIAGGLSPAEQAELWHALYLPVAEIAELLQFVKTAATQPFVYPMCCFAAHTGARRSELLRLRITDLDLPAQRATIHEKKRVRGKVTTRSVPLSPFLVGVLQAWLQIHPGGPYLFSHETTVSHSKKRSTTTGHKGQKTRAKTTNERLSTVRRRAPAGPMAVTPSEAHDHLKRTLTNSKWQLLRGWHVFRHSCCSALAAQGVDQRIIDEIMGHQTEEMRRRYRHLLPSLKQEAVSRVFG